MLVASNENQHHSAFGLRAMALVLDMAFVCGTMETDQDVRQTVEVDLLIKH